MTNKKYRINALSQGGIEDNIIHQIVGNYDSLREARDQIPDDWVVDDNTDIDVNGEVYYPSGTEPDDMDGYGGLISITVVIDD